MTGVAQRLGARRGCDSRTGLRSARGLRGQRAPLPRCRATMPAEQSSSTMTGETQLEQLKAMSTVVADTGDVSMVEKYKPVDCTTNPSLVLKAVQMPAYEHYLSDAIAAVRGSDEEVDPERPFAGVVDRLIVSLGKDLLEIVPGRVSTEVDAHLSYDTAATVAKARKLVGLYADAGVGKERIYVKIASTWEGIQAAAELEAEGVNCNLTLLFSFAQAVACANAKATLISPFVGRILDWHKANSGRDSYPAPEDPGVLSVQRIYRYYKRYGVKTIVMAASFRSADEIRELAGCDNITIAPPLLGELHASTAPLPRRLEPEAAAAACDDEDLSGMDAALFEELHGADQMAVDKLAGGIEGFAADQRKLEDLLATMAADKGLGDPSDDE